ncbi:MAG: cation:proton antiporter, partial [Roseibacillus sp.]|nr:cation:proton antiporter [Roseibacillus sp.]
LNCRAMPFASAGEISPLFGLLTLVLVGVVLVSLVLLRFRQSLLVGYFLSGVLLANSGLLDWVGADSSDLDRLAELGVILLLFTLGLEFSLTEIKHLRRVALLGGGLQVGLVGLVSGATCVFFGFPFPVAIALAVAIALSSTAVSIKAFHDLGMADSPAARLALGVAIFQDILVIFFMIILPPLLGQGSGSMSAGIGIAVLKGLLFLAAGWFLSRRGIPQILHAVARTRSRELFTVTVVGLCAAVAFGAVQLNLSAALGAFAAGLVVSESIYSHRVLADILPFRDLFLTIFFVSIGLLIDLGEVASNWALITSVTLIILVIKFGAGFLAAKRLGVGLRPCLLAAAALASTGEFSLVLFERIADFGVFESWPELEQVLLVSTAIGMGFVPALMRFSDWLVPALERRGWLQGKADPVVELTPEGEREALSGHVIVCGYGPVGRVLQESLAKCNIGALILELNADTVHEMVGHGILGLYADARQPEALEMAGVERARGIAFTFPDVDAAIAGMRLARQRNPEILVYARAKFTGEADRLREEGADHVFHDEQESGQALIKCVLTSYVEQDVLDDFS